MAKVSKKQLGARRRRALFFLIVLIIAVPLLISKCTAEETSVKTQIQTKTTAETTAADEEMDDGVLYTGTLPLTTEMPLPTEPSQLSMQSYQLDVTPVLQTPELPTGCEVTSLTMALNYAGYAVDKVTMADDYLIRSDPYLTTFGEAFVGSPHDSTAWGCYAPVIEKTAENFITAQGGDEVVQDLTGCSMKTLLWEVSNGTPVITWVSIGLTSNIEERYYWTTPDGEDAVFLINEHCVLLCGYDLTANTVTVCDPLEGMAEYDLDTFTDRYETMYCQAVVIQNSNTDTTNSQKTNAQLAGS